MAYASSNIKKRYEEQCKEQRAKNLTKLRVDIAKMPKQVDFKETMGFTKNDLSTLESGDKTLSLFHIHAYKTYFKDNFNLDVSADFLLGYTDVIENQSMDIANDLGLSNDAIRVFKEMSETEHDVFNKLASEDGLLRLLLLELWDYANNSTFVDMQISNHITGDIKKITDNKKIESIMRYQATDTFNMVLYFIKKAFSDSVLQAADNKLDLLKTKIELYKLKEQLIQNSPNQKGSD